jgi:hypothetical protein
VLRNDGIHFQLRIKNYNDLRQESLTPHVLVVVLVPEDVSNWLTQTEDELVMRRCGYWVSLRNAVELDNQDSALVVLPRAQMFTPESLKRIMTTVNEGGLL